MLVLAAFVSGCASVRESAGIPQVAVEEEERLEVFEAEVLKVVTAKHDDALFRAYVVEWENQRVVVSDKLALSNCEEGETLLFRKSMEWKSPNIVHSSFRFDVHPKMRQYTSTGPRRLSDRSKASDSHYRRFQSEVLKVYSARDGQAVFRAYLTVWNGQEVIVSDDSAISNYTEGDVIEFLVFNQRFPYGWESHRLMSFGIAPRSLPPSGIGTQKKSTTLACSVDMEEETDKV